MSSDLDIAIVGMSCRLPGAHNLHAFWANLVNGIESIRRFSDDEMLHAGVSRSYLSNASYVKAAAALEAPGYFDAEFFGFSQREAEMMDPQHRILLELAHEALEHAGYSADSYGKAVGVFTGCAMNTYFMNVGLNGRFNEEYIPTLIGNDKDFVSTRISYKLNLKGPSLTVQTACSTSMVAVHLARQSLLSGETDMALAGGISVRVPHNAGYFCDGGGIVSPDGHVRAFDARANGTVFGSGGGVLVLKRLADAHSDRDTVYAVIKGSAVNNDGSDKAGYAAPSVNSQADVVVEALANAGVNPDTISYIEAHGSGTPVGDPIELQALTKAFRVFTKRSGYCAIGSVKTNVGHLDAAAAITGIIKTTLALNHRQIPASLNFNEANPEIDFASTPFFVNTELRHWESVEPRRAGVMSTGMGGTNAHIVLEEAPRETSLANQRPPYLLLLSAQSATALDQGTDSLCEFLRSDQSINMSDVAYTLRHGRRAFQYRRHVVCADRNDGINKLEQTTSQKAVCSLSDVRRPLILLLPGIGDHYVGMAYELYEQHVVFREEVDRCADLLEPYLGIDIREIIYPKSMSWKNSGPTRNIDLNKMLAGNGHSVQNDDVRNLNNTRFAQPALFTIEYAMTRLWESFGVKPDAIVGHSMGEYVAACLAGVFSLEDTLRLIATRARLVNDLPQGAMVAVLLQEDELLPLLNESLSVSLINGPSLCVVAGPVPAVRELEKDLNTKGVLWRRIQNGHAFHSKMLDPIVAPFENELRKVRLNKPTIPYISNVTGDWITAGEATSPAYWARHATHQARFNNALHHLWHFRNPILLEAGPGRTLITLALQHPAKDLDQNALTIQSLRYSYENRPDIEVLMDSVGNLWTGNVDIRWENVYRGEAGRRIALPTYRFQRKNCWLQPVSSSKVTAKTENAIQKNPDMSQWLYLQSWKRVLPKTVEVSDLESYGCDKWLFFADNRGLCSALINTLRAAGCEVITVRPGSYFQQVGHDFTIDPSSNQDFDRLIHLLKSASTLPDHIVHGWSFTETSSDESAGDFMQDQVLGFYSLICLTRALAAHDSQTQFSLSVLSNDTQDVVGAERLAPSKSTLLGPCMVIRQEYPNIRTKHIDVQITPDAGEYELTAPLLLHDILDSGPTLFVAYRNHQRWVQIYEPLINETSQRPVFRHKGVYLITGGLGAVGSTIAEYLITSYQASIVLVGRSNLPDGFELDAALTNRDPERSRINARIRTLQRLEELGGQVMYLSADVSAASGMETVLQETYKRFGALHGVIHGAGIVGDYLEIKDTTIEKCDPHFKAKAGGLAVLENVLEGKSLDFCLLLSSLASSLGGLGQAVYASANIYMDAFARRHNRSSSVPWLSVNWDVWRDAGSQRSTHPGSTLKDLGMSPSEATSMMETVLAMRHVDHLIVSTGDLEARINQWIKLESLKGAAIANATRYSKVSEDPTEQRLAMIWQDTLGVDDIGVHDSFGELGGNSLLAIRIVSEMRKAFPIDVGVRALFDAPTIAELAGYVKQQIFAKIEALTEEEAKVLLRMSEESDNSNVTLVLNT